jgi:hypothetical protein
VSRGVGAAVGVCEAVADRVGDAVARLCGHPLITAQAHDGGARFLIGER